MGSKIISAHLESNSSLGCPKLLLIRWSFFGGSLWLTLDLMGNLVLRNNAWCELQEHNLQGAPLDYPAWDIVRKEEGLIMFPARALRMPGLYASEPGSAGQRERRAEVLNLCFATDCNTSDYKLLIEETGKYWYQMKRGLMRFFSAEE